MDVQYRILSAHYIIDSLDFNELDKMRSKNDMQGVYSLIKDTANKRTDDGDFNGKK